MDGREDVRMMTGLGAGLALLLLGCPGDDGSTETGAETVSNDSTSNPGTTMGSDSTPVTGSAGSGSAEGSGSGGSGQSGSSGGSGSGSMDSTSAADSSGGSTAGVCMDAMGSCANGEQCCDGLTCCAGVPVPPGEEYCDQRCPDSDYNLKRDFESIDPAEILERVAALPITTWSYRREDPSVRHLGPMAQDFKASFGLGATDRSIFVVDADGVALSSIQALYRRLQASEADNAKLRESLETLQRRVEALESRSSKGRAEHGP